MPVKIKFSFKDPRIPPTTRQNMKVVKNQNTVEISMWRGYKTRMRSSGGYTLGELMLVVAIISLLASIFEPKIANQIMLARESVVLGDLGAVRGAVAIYYADTEGNFPNDLSLGLTQNGQYMSSIPSIAVPEVDAQDNPGFSSTNRVVYGDGTTPPFGS